MDGQKFKEQTPKEQTFTGVDKLYTFNIYDRVNVKYDIHNRNESYKDFKTAFALNNGLMLPQ